MILEVKGLTKSYWQGDKELKILDNMNLKIDRPQTLSILGRSGSGKSTLLSLLGGLDKVDSGQILVKQKKNTKEISTLQSINDETISKESVKDSSMINLATLSEKELTQFRSSHLGIIFQDFHLMKNFTALENVMLALEILKKPNTYTLARECLEIVGLGDRSSHFPHELSGGECQRVAIARAIVTRPEIILADEPSGNLDSETGTQVMEFIFKIARTLKRTLILVTHDKELASRCDHIYELKNKTLAKLK